MSVFKLNGLVVPWSFWNNPQALQRVFPSGSFLQSGVFRVWQLWHSVGAEDSPAALLPKAPWEAPETVDAVSLLLRGESTALGLKCCCCCRCCCCCSCNIDVVKLDLVWFWLIGSSFILVMLSLYSLLLVVVLDEVGVFFWGILSWFWELHDAEVLGVSELFLLLLDELLPGGESSFILVGVTYALTELLAFAVVVDELVTDFVMPSLLLFFKSSRETGDNKSNAFMLVDVVSSESLCSFWVFEFSFLSCLFSTRVCNRNNFLADRKSSRMDGAESSSSLACII